MTPVTQNIAAHSNWPEWTRSEPSERSQNDGLQCSQIGTVA